jgi:adenosylcobinamide-GDP ribazoletransferase
MKSFLAALQFLTIFPWPRRAERTADEIAAGSVFFPVIGFLLGLVLVLVNSALKPFVPAGILSVALVALLALLSRGLHLDGLADTFDGLGAGGERARVLRVMDDPCTGVFGVLAVVLVVFFKDRAIELMDAERWRALLMAPLLGRWAMVLLAYRSLAAREGLGSTLIGHMAGRHFFFATVVAGVLATVFSGVVGIALMIGIAFFTLACKSYFHRRLGGVTGDIFGAVGELSETSVLVFFALGQR